MKVLVCVLVLVSFISVDLYERNQKSPIKQKVQSVFTNFSTGFEDIYQNEQFLYSLKFKELPYNALGSCNYDKTSNIIEIEVNPKQAVALSDREIKNFLLHEIEYCSQTVIKRNESFSSVERMGQIQREALVSKYFNNL